MEARTSRAKKNRGRTNHRHQNHPDNPHPLNEGWDDKKKLSNKWFRNFTPFIKGIWIVRVCIAKQNPYGSKV